MTSAAVAAAAPPAALVEQDGRPTLRGMLCVYGLFGFAVAGAALLAFDPSARRWPIAVFLLSVVALMGTSGLYHRVRWSVTAYYRMRRLDHAMIFVLITGTETPLFLVGLEGRGLDWMFYTALAFAAAGFAITMFWVSAPKWVRAVVYVVVGWSGVPAIPHIVEAMGIGPLALLLGGGLLYSIGAVAYALKRPNPWPGHFGYHEVFHAFVVAAAATHFAVIAGL
ncbi:MAG: hemolysin III family protein [Myxococcales bacterium]|nr:hemolysin III family protein [Myxococcales bacterium]